MTGKRIDIDLSTLGKAFVIFILLLILSFVLGLYLGRESNNGAPIPDGGAARDEQFTACSYKLQELTGKLTALTALAHEKGLIDQNGAALRDAVCAIPAKQAAAEPQRSEAKTEPAKVEPPKTEPQKPEPPKVVEPPKKSEKQVPCRFALQLFADRDREKALTVQEKLKIKPTRLVEGVVSGVTWYRIRYGCYADKAAAETAIEELMRSGARPIIVNE